MKTKQTRPLTLALTATALLLGHATVQAQPGVAVRTKGGGTMTIATNGGVTVVTSFSTNVGGTAVGSASIQTDPQVVVRVLAGAPGGQAGGQPVDVQALVKAMNAALGQREATAPAPAGTRPVTWLGIVADDVSDDLRAQLPIPDGAGLLVRDVTEGSPAARAGVKVNDVLVKMNGELLRDSAQMKSLILNCKEGDEAAITLYRKGREMQVKPRLVKRIPTSDDADTPDVIDLGAFDLDLGKTIGKLGSNGSSVVIYKSVSSSGSTNAAGGEDVQRAMNEMMKNMIEQVRKGTRLPADK